MKKHYKKLLLVSILFTLMLASALPAMGALDKVRVFVEFAPGMKGQVEQMLSREGAQFHYTFDELRAFVVTVPAQALQGLERNPNIVDIEEDAARYPVEAIPMEAVTDAVGPWADIPNHDGTAETLPWGVQAVQAPEAWADADYATTGGGVKVCIIDSGYYSEHEDLPDLSDTDGYSQVDDDWMRDLDSHGSHVAGTIAAINNDKGVIGVAPSASLFIVKIFGDDGLWVSEGHASDLIAAAFLCRDNGADIISMSLSGTQATGKEERAFDTVYAQGLLSIGAASNDGIEEYHYPASYESVISVAALDSNAVVADFSQFNDAVEIAAPGVGILSTTSYLETTTMEVGGSYYQVNHIEFSKYGTATGPLVDGGFCGIDDIAPEWAGAVVLCERGQESFAAMVLNVETGLGVAAAIYNREADTEAGENWTIFDNFWGTMSEDSSELVIGVSLSRNDGLILLGKLGQEAEIFAEYIPEFSGYEAWGGTSMATPHVSAVAALLWSAYPDATNVEIREAISETAYDLGEPGRDVYYGYGLIQAHDALMVLSHGGGGGPLTVTAATEEPVYGDREYVNLEINVTHSGVPKADAEVTAVITSPKGKVTTYTGFTDANGDVIFTFMTHLKRDGAGEYEVAVTASHQGFENGFTTTSFIVE